MSNQSGFGLIALLLGVLVLGLLGWGAFSLYGGNNESVGDNEQRVQQEAEAVTDDNEIRNDTLERATKLEEGR